jgi:hypothetical protein
MGAGVKLAALGITVVLLLTVGCGADGGGESRNTVEAFSNYDHLKGPTREFIVPGGDNIVQLFGREASHAQREEASRVIDAWMQARAHQDWKEVCSQFSRRYRKYVTADANSVTEGDVKNCPQALAYFGPKASGDYKNNLAGPIDSLRIGEGRGFAQYHGREGKDWIVPVDLEHGKWKVEVATPVDRNE